MKAAGVAEGEARPAARPSLRERFYRLRDRILADPDFTRRASGTMLGRAIARREARALFDVAAGFVYAQVLSAVLRLKLLETLREDALSIPELARRLDLPERACAHLLLAAEPMRLVARRGERWGLGYRGAALLGNPGVVAMVHHHDLLYRELADPVALLRRGIGSDMHVFWPYAGGGEAIDPDSVAGYSRLMAASQHFIANEILAAYDFGRHQHVLDVGGGEGVFAMALAARHPSLAVTVLDLPPVAERARARFAEAGAGDRLDAVGADFMRENLPAGADCITLVRIVHDHDDEAALRLLHAVHDALPEGGTLVLAEPTAGSAAAPGITTYFAVYLLAMGSGRPRTVGELRTLLHRAGFASTRCLRERNPTATRVITAKRGGAA